MSRHTAWRVAPTLIAAALAALWLALDVRGGDLAAAEFRSWLFGEQGFAIWNNAWFGGHHVPAYSVLFPPLGWLIGPRLVGVPAVIAAAALFEALARRQWGAQARWGALWFGAWAPLSLYTDARIPFAVGVAVGLGALLLHQRGRRVPALVVAAACALTSPVAGLFLAIAGIAIAAVDRSRAGSSLLGGLALAGAALLPIGVVAFLFPEGGYQPWALSSFAAVPLVLVAALWLVPPEHRGLRAGAVVFLLVAIAAFAVPNPVGFNVVRLGTLFAAPLLACVLLPPRLTAPVSTARRTGILLLLAWTTWWGLYPAVRDTVETLGDPAAQVAYYAPLLDELARRDPSGRIEVPFTRARWETDLVARRYPLARGWERQLDTRRNPIFYEGPLDPVSYREWLVMNAVEYVAVPDARLDYSSEAERALIRSGLPYLDRIWESDHWTLYRFPAAATIAGPGGGTLNLEPQGFVLHLRPPQTTVAIGIRWSPYWYAPNACLSQTEDGFTEISHAGGRTVSVGIRVDPRRRRDDRPRCGI